MLEKIQTLITNFQYSNTLFLTIGILFTYQIVKFVIIKKVESNSEDSNEERLIVKKRIEFYGRFLLVVAIFSLWFTQLQTVFVSLFAVAAAIVIALKEIIMCMTGGMLIRMNKYFLPGHRIEIDGTRGFVLDWTITSTKVLELGPEKTSQQTTGNIITIPNSIFLSKAVVNESYFQNYSIRSFTLSPPENIDIEAAEEKLLTIANEVSKSYLKKAKESISKFCKKEGLSIPTVEPRIKLLLLDNNEAKFLLKIPVDNKKVGDIEQDIFRQYYKFIKSIKKENEEQ